MDVHLLRNNFCFNNNFDACGYPKLYRSMGTKFCSFFITHHVARHVITLLFKFVCLGMNLLVWTNLKILIMARLVEAENFDWYLKISALLILTEVNKICKYWSLTPIPLNPPPLPSNYNDSKVLDPYTLIRENLDDVILQTISLNSL